MIICRKRFVVLWMVVGVLTVNPVFALTPAPDFDADGVEDLADICPFTPDPGQEDTDLNGVGNACEPFCLPTFGDVSGNGVTDIVDAQCTILTSLWALAATFDPPPSCLAVAPEQADADCSGDVAVTDVLLVIGVALGSQPGPDLDADFDGCPDTCQTTLTDSDDDGVPDGFDNCPTVPNAAQNDVDDDSTGDVCDGCPLDPTKTSLGVCGCGIADDDADEDGLADCVDACDDTVPVIATPGGPSVAVPMSAGSPGCVAFTAAANQRLSILMISNLGECLEITVLDPAGEPLFGPELSCSATSFTDLLVAANAGTYQLHMVPSNAATGNITVTVFDVPPDANHGGILGGPTVPVSLLVPAQNGAVQFEAAAGTRAAFRSVASPTKCTRYSLLAPNGTALIGPVLECSSEYFTDLVVLTQPGTYTLLLDPHNEATSSYTVQGFIVQEDDVELAGAFGTTSQLTLEVPSQNGFVEFAASAGDRISVLSQASPTICRTFSILSPSGITIVPPALVCSGTQFIDTVVVPETGIYSIFIDPKGAAITTENTTVFLVPDDVIETTTPGSSAVVLPLLVPGLDGFVEFEGSVGQRISITATRSPNGCTRFGLTGPLGTVFVPQLTCGAYFVDSMTLPATGIYTLSVDQHDQYAGTHTITVFDVPSDIVQGATIGGPSVGLTTTVPGQNGFVTFSGTAGVQIGIVASHVPGGCINHRLFNPSGTTLFGPQLACGTLTTATLTLPETGTYSFAVDGSGTYVGTTTVSVLAK